MVFKTFFKACAKLALYMTAGFLGGLLVAAVIALLDGDPTHNMDTQKANMETYYHNMRVLP